MAEIPWLRGLTASGYHGLRRALDAEGSRSSGKPIVERISLWIGVLGSVITILLTAWNTQTKNEIDRRGEALKALEVKLKERSTGIEESKERVDRYKWVLSLLPSLTEKDDTKRNFTLSLVRLALTKDEAEQLFAGLQQSPNQELKQVAQQGIDSIENQAVSRLVLQINATAADDRKRAVADLERDYKASPVAIARVLDLYSEQRIANLSPSGVINGLYFLGTTDPQARTPALVRTARQALARVSDRNIGPQTKEALQKVNALLATVSKTATRTVGACNHLSVTAEWQGAGAPEQQNTCSYTAPPECRIVDARTTIHSESNGSRSVSISADGRTLNALVKARPHGSVLDRKRGWVDASVEAVLECSG